MAVRLTNASIPKALSNFDSLPDSAYVRQPVVQGLFGCSAASVWRGVRDGRLPAPRKLSSRTTAWKVADLRATLAAIGEAA